jgi:hypothetical protein
MKENSSCLKNWYEWEQAAFGERPREGEYGTNIVHTCRGMEK